MNADHLQVIWSGCRVAIELIGVDQSREKMAFQIVPDELADFPRGFVGESTPLAKALIGHTAGETVAYPVDDIREVVILGVEVAEGLPDRSVIERREAVLRKALRQSELANLISFAASFNSKWGNYDPESLVDEWEQDS